MGVKYASTSKNGCKMRGRGLLDLSKVIDLGLNPYLREPISSPCGPHVGRLAILCFRTNNSLLRSYINK